MKTSFPTLLTDRPLLFPEASVTCEVHRKADNCGKKKNRFKICQKRDAQKCPYQTAYTV